MTLQNLYIKVQKKKITKQRFLAEARRHAVAGRLVTSLNSFEDTVKILKNNGLISEAKGVKQQNENKFNLNRYLREIDDEEGTEEEEATEDAPEEEAPEEEVPAEDEAPAPDQEDAEEAPEEEEAGLSPELGGLVDKFLQSLKKIDGHDDMGMVALYVEEIMNALPFGKQGKISILNTLRSKFSS
jgi:hypothetical protein